jgi:hypothetical protein
MGGKAVGAAANNSAVQQRVGNYAANTAQQQAQQYQ